MFCNDDDPLWIVLVLLFHCTIIIIVTHYIKFVKNLMLLEEKGRVSRGEMCMRALHALKKTMFKFSTSTPLGQ